jgi:hypothetical protein
MGDELKTIGAEVQTRTARSKLRTVASGIVYTLVRW